VNRLELAAAGAALLALQPAGASHGATLQIGLTATVPVRSLTISVRPAGAGTSCSATLRNSAVSIAFAPTDDCRLQVGTVTITNGALPAHIDVVGADATPADGGKHWTLCGTPNRPCLGKHARPGTDQLAAATIAGAKKPTTGTSLDYTPACDTAFGLATGNPTCTASARQQADEGLTILVATSSTDTSKLFATPVTWIAAA
jgi:hypothetical protein